MGLRHGAPNGLKDRRRIEIPPEFPVDFERYRQPLFAIHIDRKSRRFSRRQAWVTIAGGGLDIVRIVVDAANDDQVFQPSRYGQPAAIKKAQIAGAQITQRLVSGKVCAKSVFRLLRPSPVTRRDAWARDPDFSLFTIGP